MVWAAGQTLTATDLNKAIAQAVRYERQTGSQVHATGTDLQVSFPTAVNPHPDVVASITAPGTETNCFTVAAGIWLVTASIRISTAHASREMSIAAGAATWTLANLISGTGSAAFSCAVPGLVVATAATAVTVGSFQGSGANSDIVSWGHLTHIAFARLA
jgi:hypothetical protein